MGKGSAHDQAQHRHGAVGAALAGEHQLAQGAAAQQHAAKAHQHHAQAVPQTVGMGDGLALKGQVEIGAVGGAGEDQVAHQGADQDGAEAHQQLGLPEQHHVTDAAHHAQAGPLGQSAHDQARRQADEHGSVLGAGAAAGLGEVDEGGSRHQQDKHHHLDGREQEALQPGHGIGALQGIALLQEEHARQNAQHEAKPAQQSVQVAAGQAQDHAEGAAQEHQAADHHEKAQHEAGQGRAAALGGELTLEQGDAEAAQHQADDLRPDILHGSGPVQAQTACGIPQEAGDAEAHVGRVAEKDQQRRNDADDQARNDDMQALTFDVHLEKYLSLLKNSGEYCTI